MVPFFTPYLFTSIACRLCHPTGICPTCMQPCFAGKTHDMEFVQQISTSNYSTILKFSLLVLGTIRIIYVCNFAGFVNGAALANVAQYIRGGGHEREISNAGR